MPDAHRSYDLSAGFPPSRREFVRVAGTTTLAVSLAAIGARPIATAPAQAGPRRTAPVETPVARFYRELDDDQRRSLCFPSDHPKRSLVGSNWAIVKPAIKDLSREQQALCREIFKGLCSEDGHERFLRQMEDDYGGFDKYHVAVFGEPGSDKQGKDEKQRK